MILLLTVFVDTDEPEDSMILGLAVDIRSAQNGYIFTIEDTDGEMIKCFTSFEPSKNEVYSIKGTYSEDGSMFFVSSIQPVNHNEF